MTVAPVSQNDLQVNMVSPAKEALNQVLPGIPKELIGLVNDYLTENIVILFLKTIALPHIQDPAVAQLVRDDAHWYGKSITKVDLSRTSVSFYHGDAPYPTNWFQTRVDDVLNAFFLNVTEIITPSAGRVTRHANDSMIHSCRHDVSLEQYNRPSLIISQPQGPNFWSLVYEASKNNPAYDITIHQRTELDHHRYPHQIKIVTYIDRATNEIFTAKMKKIEQSLPARFAAECSMNSGWSAPGLNRAI